MSSSLPPYEPQPSYLRSLMHDYHQQINARAQSAVDDLQQRWVSVRAALNADIARLQQQMETAIAHGDKITYAWLADAQRLAALKASVEGNIAQFADATRQLVADGQLSALDLGTNAAQEALAATVPPGVAYTFGVPPADVLHAQAGALSPSSPLTALFAQLGPDAAKSAQAALFTSVALGEGPRAAATRLFWNTNLPRQRAEVIARTEILRSWRGAQMENYRANQDVVSGWQWSADFSDRTCGACIAMDGTIHDLSEDLDDHIMGRCSALPITKPWSDILAGTGADTSGLTETSIASWDSYLYGNGFAADWFEGLAPEVQNSILGPAKAEAYRAGDLDLKQLAGVRRDPVWGDSIQEVSLKQLGMDAQEYLAAARANGTESVVADAEALAQAQAGTPAAMAETMAGESEVAATETANGTLEEQAQRLMTQADASDIEAAMQGQSPMDDTADMRLQAAKMLAQFDAEQGGVGAIITSDPWFEENGGVYTKVDPLDMVNQVFGRDITRDELARLVGASEGDVVTIEYGVSSDKAFEYLVTREDGFHASGEFYRDGRRIILEYGEVFNPAGARDAGSGVDILETLDYLRTMGVKRINTYAAGSFDTIQSGYRGYYTWARLGFTGRIPDDVIDAVRARFGPGVNTIQKLMAQPGGPAWWKVNGEGWEASFNFKSGSYSRQVLDDLLARLRARQARGGIS